MIHSIRWTAEKIASRLELIEPLVYRRRQSLPPFRALLLSSPADEPPVGAGVDDSAWETLVPPVYWAGRETDFVLRTQLAVPEAWPAGAPLALLLPLGVAGDFSHPEALAYLDGAPYAACDRHHQEVRLPDACRDGREHLLALHGWTGIGLALGARLLMRPAELVQLDQPTRDFVAAARVALGVARQLGQHDPARAHLLTALNDAFCALDTREPLGDAFYASVAPAHAALRAGVAKAGPPAEVQLFATGHAHIDVAWLWTLGQTRHKAARTFHTVLRLMEQFPDYHFTQSQPQLYDFVRQDHPELFEAIKRRVAEGRWEITGDMWVEADCNLSGPESLARQFLLGRSFFRQHFGAGASSRVLWLPDVFGYAWALPQLIRQAGLDYFFTIKIGWSQYNRLPYDSFWWQGIDGTRVLTHFSTTPDTGGRHASTYNARATPQEVLGTWVNFQQKDLGRPGAPPPLLMAFGYGDGGGGPSREMLENLRELARFPGAPQVRQGSVRDFFAELEGRAGDLLPTWDGELYLEFHRGTYTSQSRNKRANRKSEFLLHDAEFLASQARLLDPAYCYPAEQLARAWQLVCLNQFHDIIPGSSITAVYADSLAQYDEVAALGAAVRDAALASLGARLGGDLLVANPCAFARADLALWPERLPAGHHLRHADGRPVRVQPVEGGTLLDAGLLPPYAVAPLALTQGEPPEAEQRLWASPRLLENPFVLVELDEAGDITRIYDKAHGREVLPPGARANQLLAFEDRPINWDAWDIDIFYDDRAWTAEPASAVRVVEHGPLRATLEVRRQILYSHYTQRISLSHNSPQIDIDTTIDWRERHILLKAAFPVDILAPAATYEIQWGNVQRPTHRNTSWDWARFETCAQKWVDLSEGDYGVSLLNDCKYGHDVQGNVIRISLLRSPTHPDPQADQGEHTFRYSLLPHAGGWGEATIAAAYALNDPVVVTRNPHPGGISATQATPPLILANRPNVVVETVKWAEDGNGLIVRLYESQRRRGPALLTLGFDLAGAWRTNLLEEDQERLPTNGRELSLRLRPYEIVTLRLVPQEGA